MGATGQPPTLARTVYRLATGQATHTCQPHTSINRAGHRCLCATAAHPFLAHHTPHARTLHSSSKLPHQNLPPQAFPADIPKRSISLLVALPARLLVLPAHGDVPYIHK